LSEQNKDERFIYFQPEFNSSMKYVTTWSLLKIYRWIYESENESKYNKQNFSFFKDWLKVLSRHYE
jgi:hypothetical protein